MPDERLSGAASGAAAGASFGPIGAVIGAAGGLAMGVGAKKSAAKRNRILNAMIRAQAEKQRKIDARLLQELGIRGSTTPEVERAAALSDYANQLRAHRASRAGSASPARGSSRYAADLSATEAGLGDFAGRESDISSRLVAPLRMRDKEALRQGRVESDIQGIGGEIDSSNYLWNLYLGESGGSDPGLDALGGALQGIGYGIAGRAPAMSTKGPNTGKPKPRKDLY